MKFGHDDSLGARLIGLIVAFSKRFIDFQELGKCNIFCMSQGGDRVFHGVKDDVLYLQLIFVISMRIREVAELLSQLETVSHRLRRDKIFSNFDTTMQVSHLENNKEKRVQVSLSRITNIKVVAINVYDIVLDAALQQG